MLESETSSSHRSSSALLSLCRAAASITGCESEPARTTTRSCARWLARALRRAGGRPQGRTAMALLALAGATLLSACEQRQAPPAQAPAVQRAAPAPLIVGDDDRCELYAGGQHSSDPTWMNIGRSVPALVPSAQLTRQGDQWLLEELSGLKLCPGERFKEQKAGADCSAALIGDDLILTAYHCLNDPSNGGDKIPFRKVVFGYAVDAPNFSTVGRTTFQLDEVYGISVMTAGHLGNAEDWAIAKLDRPVSPRYRRLAVANPTTQITFSTNPSVATQVYMVGYGMGKPAKISREGFTILGGNPTFRAVIEGFEGNSGSPLFDKATHAIIGVASSGPEDLVWDEAAACFHYFVCPSQTCNVTFQNFGMFVNNVSTPPPSCQGACGAQSPDGCWCDAACTGAGDCCPDKAAVCTQTTCDGVCGGQHANGCWCDTSCSLFGDCCEGYFETCSMR
jgi:hypothetical protein